VQLVEFDSWGLVFVSRQVARFVRHAEVSSEAGVVLFLRVAWNHVGGGGRLLLVRVRVRVSGGGDHGAAGAARRAAAGVHDVTGGGTA